jgi:pyruvate/2-oxoacid:ferredoxin oxidoreductase beta subunit
MMKERIPEVELMTSGHLACPGCGGALAMRYALKAIGEKAMLAIPACCWSIIAGPMPYSSLRLPLMHCAFEAAAATASGIRSALKSLGDEETTVIAWAGDGGTFDIGIQALSGAAERNDDIIYVCYDNEAYMNTGIQRSSATPWGAWTTTTPYTHPKEQPKKNMMEIMAGHRIPYAATANVAFPEDFISKMKKAKGIKGTAFIHILCPCPPGWKIQDDLSIKIARLAVETKAFPLFEIENGIKYTINYQPQGLPVEEYLKPQRRFVHLKDKDIKRIQQTVDFEWELLQKRVALTND